MQFHTLLPSFMRSLKMKENYFKKRYGLKRTEKRSSFMEDKSSQVKSIFI